MPTIFDQMFPSLAEAIKPKEQIPFADQMQAEEDIGLAEASANLPIGPLTITPEDQAGVTMPPPAASPAAAPAAGMAPAAPAMSMPETAPAPKPKLPDYFSDAAMQSAIQKQNDLMQQKAIMQGAGQLGAGIASLGAGAPVKNAVDTSALDEQAKATVGNLAMQRKGFMETQAAKEALSAATTDDEKADPASVYSKMFRQFMGQIGYNMPDSVNAKQISELLPMAAKIFEQKTARALALAKWEEAKEYKGKMLDLAERRLEAMNDRTTLTKVQQINRQINPSLASGGSTLGRASKSVQGAERMEAAMQLYGNLDHVPPQMAAEIAMGLNNLLTFGSTATVETFKKLMPKGIALDAASVQQYLTNKPVAGGVGKFIENMMNVAAREKNLAKIQVIEAQRNVLSGVAGAMKEKAPDAWQGWLQSYGLPEDVATAEFQQVIDYAKKYGISIQEALAVRKQRTGN